MAVQPPAIGYGRVYVHSKGSSQIWGDKTKTTMSFFFKQVSMIYGIRDAPCMDYLLTFGENGHMNEQGDTCE